MNELEINDAIREKGLLRARRESSRVNEAVRATVLQEAQEARIRLPAIVDILAGRLKHTAVALNRPFTEEDVFATREALVACAPFTHPKIDSHFPKHLAICGMYDAALNRAVGNTETSEYESMVKGLLHDIGRLIMPHRYLLNDGFGRYLFDRIGVRKNFRERFVESTWQLGIHKLGNNWTMEHIDEHTTAQKTLYIADNFGRLNPDGTIMRPDQLEAIAQEQFIRYGNVRWPIEGEGIRTHERKRKETVIRLLQETVIWFEERGISFDNLSRQVLEEFQNDENQKWLIDFYNARETLDPEVDQILGRSPIEYIVFDIGDVLYGGKNGKSIDDLLSEKIAGHFGCSPEEAYNVLSLLTPDVIAGRIPEEEYLRQFWQTLGKTPPTTMDELRAPFVQPDICTPIEGMQEIVDSLSKNPNIEIFCLSDAIASLTPTVLKALQRDFPQVPTEKILISNKIGAAKAENDGLAFEALLERINPQNPQAVLFIDNEGNYSAKARLRCMRGFTFRGNPYKNLSASERLRKELQKAELFS